MPMKDKILTRGHGSSYDHVLKLPPGMEYAGLLLHCRSYGGAKEQGS